jgi:hypothetical protein
MGIIDWSSQPPTDGATEYEYRGRHFRLVPRQHRAWAVVEQWQYIGVVERAYSRIGDDRPRFAAKPVGEEGVMVEGWTDDWRLALEWLADQHTSEGGGPPRKEG